MKLEHIKENDKIKEFLNSRNYYFNLRYATGGLTKKHIENTILDTIKNTTFELKEIVLHDDFVEYKTTSTEHDNEIFVVIVSGFNITMNHSRLNDDGDIVINMGSYVMNKIWFDLTMKDFSEDLKNYSYTSHSSEERRKLLDNGITRKTIIK